MQKLKWTWHRPSLSLAFLICTGLTFASCQRENRQVNLEPKKPSGDSSPGWKNPPENKQKFPPEEDLKLPPEEKKEKLPPKDAPPKDPLPKDTPDGKDPSGGDGDAKKTDPITPEPKDPGSKPSNPGGADSAKPPVPDQNPKPAETKDSGLSLQLTEKGKLSLKAPKDKPVKKAVNLKVSMAGSEISNAEENKDKPAEKTDGAKKTIAQLKNVKAQVKYDLDGKTCEGLVEFAGNKDEEKPIMVSCK